MASLPDTLYDETKAKLERLERRAHDAESFQLPRLRSHNGTLALQQQYAAELREDIESCRRELQILETFVDDIATDGHRKEVYTQLDTLFTKIDELKKQFRVALLASKRNIDSQSHSQREELLRSSALIPEARSGTSDDALMNANDAVTDALRRTTQLMHQELERSVLATQTLEESTRTMTSTSDLYTAFGTLMTTSKHLVTALEKSDWLDRLLILSSLSFFLLVVAYIIKKRVIDKGIWLAFWWVKYIPLPSSRPAVPFPVPPTDKIKTKALVDSVSSLMAASVLSAIPSASSPSVLKSIVADISSVAATVPADYSEPTLSVASTVVEEVLSRLIGSPLLHDKAAPQATRVPTSGAELDIDLDALLNEVQDRERSTRESSTPLHQEL